MDQNPRYRHPVLATLTSQTGKRVSGRGSYIHGNVLVPGRAFLRGCRTALAGQVGIRRPVLDHHLGKRGTGWEGEGWEKIARGLCGRSLCL